MLSIWENIAAENPAAAETMIRRLATALRRLEGNPLMGPHRPDIRLGVRLLPVGRYLVLYRIQDDGVEIVRVVHGARNLKDLI